MLLEIRRYAEVELAKDLQKQIAILLHKCFPDTHHQGLHYFKQLPHFRLLAFEDDMLIGHIGIDYRVMRLNDIPIAVFSLYNLCVLEDKRNRYIGSFLIEEVEKLAVKSNADFIFVLSNSDAIFLKHKFKHVENVCTWFNINEHKSISIEDEFITQKILIKEISNKKWEAGNLDVLGYLP